MSSGRVTIVPDHLDQSASRLEHLADRLWDTEVKLIHQTAELPETLAEFVTALKMPIARGIRLETDRLRSIARRLRSVAAAARRAAEEGIDFDDASSLHIVIGPAAHATTPPQGGPEQVARWWASLSPEERQWQLEHHPELVGSLDGVPAEWRDRANRLLLQRRIDWLQWKHDTGRGSTDEYTELQRDRQLLAILGSPPDAAGHDLRHPGLFLLGFDPDRQHVIVAVGDPDLATNAAVFVPGLGSDWSSVPGNVAAVQRLHDQAQRDAPGASVSTILWIGYDAPAGGHVAEVGLPFRAEAGAQPLDSFIYGLRATHQGQPADLTLIGHSYGSLVVGEAAAHAPHALPVNNIVFVGSPGTGVQNVSQFHLAHGAEVYAGTHPLDFARGASVLPGAFTVPGVIDDMIHRGERQAQFGADPTDGKYGAIPLPIGGLSSEGTPGDFFHDYLDPSVDKKGFDNLAYIVAGQAPARA